MSLALKAYGLTMRLLEPLAPQILRRRAARGREDPSRVEERLGFSTLGRPGGPLVWIHGASVGETLSALPLIEQIGRERSGVTVLVTSGTTTSAEILARRLPAFALHQYVPVDGPAAVTRFLDHWRPDLLILLEGELWPNLLRQARARGCRLALVSARFTEASARGWQRARGAARELLSGFDLVLPQDDASAIRLSDLGARVGGRANLKLAGSALTWDAATLAALRAEIGQRPVIVSASTHSPEERITDAAVAALEGEPLHLIVPRHPDRADQIEAELILTGRTVARRSRRDPVTPQTDIYLADTLGEMGLFFELADLVLLGGGWADGVGGHNPLEPARQGRAVISGPLVSNWAGVFAAMARDDAIRLAGPDALAEMLAALMADPKAREALGRRALAFAETQRDVIAETWSLLSPQVPRCS